MKPRQRISLFPSVTSPFNSITNNLVYDTFSTRIYSICDKSVSEAQGNNILGPTYNSKVIFFTSGMNNVQFTTGEIENFKWYLSLLQWLTLFRWKNRQLRMLLWFQWTFQGGTSFVDLLCFFLSCVCYAFVRVCLYVPCSHLLGKGWPLGSRLWCLTVSLSLSHWYPG